MPTLQSGPGKGPGGIRNFWYTSISLPSLYCMLMRSSVRWIFRVVDLGGQLECLGRNFHVCVTVFRIILLLFYATRVILCPIQERWEIPLILTQAATRDSRESRPPCSRPRARPVISTSRGVIRQNSKNPADLPAELQAYQDTLV